MRMEEVSVKWGVGLGCHQQRVWRAGQDASQTVLNNQNMSRETALISCLTLRASIHYWKSRSSMSMVEWPGLNPNGWSEIRPPWKVNSLMTRSANSVRQIRCIHHTELKYGDILYPYQPAAQQSLKTRDRYNTFQKIDEGMRYHENKMTFHQDQMLSFLL